ncbi:hypothetical protein AAY473_008582 [Plecturocebus cupreus]
MVLKEAHPTSVLPTVSTSEMYYSVSAQSITETSFQVMETSLGMNTSWDCNLKPDILSGTNFRILQVLQ